MSALYTALVESETKETLALSLLQHREALRKAEKAIRLYHEDYLIEEGALALADEAKAVLDTMIFRPSHL